MGEWLPIIVSLAVLTKINVKNLDLRSNCFVGLFGIFLFFWSSNLHAEDPERPNIIWIIAEDMSPDLGCYGNQVVTTPNIDGLAEKGMQFTHVFTTSPACSPSRTALATGVFQTTLGAHHMRYSKELMPTLPQPVKTLPQLMGERGYYTGNIKGLGGTGKDDWQFKTSKKSWDTHSWQKLVKNQPFFAQINSRESHRGFYPAKNIPKEKIVIPPYYPDHPVTRSDWAGYFESINRFDKQVGTIIKQLQKREYYYKCDDQPLVNFCNKSLCITRKYGVGPGELNNDLSSLTKIDGDPPIWLLNVDGSRVELSTEALVSQLVFQRECVAQINKYPVSMSAKA
ncbi:MAG: hypothetical protein EBY48_10650, partial [Opitutae bacterium]|nr:hypothetical protein [Opitutae bacterium]